MATSLADQGTIAADPLWQARVKQAAMTAATQIMGELQTTLGDVQWEKRQDLAAAILRADGQRLMAFYWAVIANIAPDPATADQSTIVDLDITNAVSAVWDDISGVRKGDEVVA